MKLLLALSLLWIAAGTCASELTDTADPLIEAVTARVISWRRDIHEHPELSNREFRTAALVAEHLTRLGLEVKTDVAHTGVVAFLRGARDRPVVALRADMDGLPVTEKVDLPFASKAKGSYRGAEVGVMHACGHDNHVAILMGVAEVLAGMKVSLPGSVKFIFQPAEEGAPDGETGGADLMIEEGVLKDVAAIFGLHVMPAPLGTLSTRPGGMMASSDSFRIVVKGRQTHGAIPWGGIDPIVVASQIVLGLQTIPSRQLDATLTPSIVTVGSFQGGVRSNIIPAQVEMLGTIRTFDENVRFMIHEKVRNTAVHIAESAGAKAEVTINRGTAVTANDPDLTASMKNTLLRVAGPDKFFETPRLTVAEDFASYQQKIPGMFVFLGVADPADTNPAMNHSPYFKADERALPVGVKALTYLALDYLDKD